ncbi:PDZ domain-containing protein [Candidatus Babeliales bacterium]|nr:PDZ domain-containing protein [Candidatus Babeliales bacterium]
MKTSARIATLLCTLLLPTILFAPEDTKTPKDQTPEIYRWLKTTAEVVSTVQTKSFRNVDFSRFLQEAIKASVSSIDSHSSFIENYEEITDDTAGKFSGIGASMIAKPREDDVLVIVEVLDGSPAQKAGLLAGDKIVAVNDEKLSGISFNEVVTKIRGKRGTKVKLKIIRDKKPMEYWVTRDIIKNQSSYCYHFEKQNVYCFVLKNFTENSTNQMRDLLKQAQNDKHCKGVILDLRGNPGGVMGAAIDMASLFLPKGSLITSTRDNQNNMIRSYSTTKEQFLTTKRLPIFVLINNFTASASEIMAGALKHHSTKLSEDEKTREKAPMVFIVGTSTFGKGSVQEVIPVSNGSALKLTTMLYFLPDDTSIQEKGVVPDIVIKPKTVPERDMKWITELFGKEKAMKHHITAEEVEHIRAGKKPELTSIIDEKEAKKRRETDIKREKEEENGKDSSKEEDYDEKTGKKLTFQEKQERSIASNHQIQSCVNMINMLNTANKFTPKEVETRKKAINFLKSNFVTDEEVSVKRLK